LQASNDSFVHLVGVKLAMRFTPLGTVGMDRAMLLPGNKSGRHCTVGETAAHRD